MVEIERVHFKNFKNFKSNKVAVFKHQADDVASPSTQSEVRDELANQRIHTNQQRRDSSLLKNDITCHLLVLSQEDMLHTDANMNY